MIWSVDRGRVVSDRIDVNVDVHIDMAGRGQTLHADLALAMAFQIDPLSAEKVIPPTVGQYGLVVPGKSIGPDALPNTVADLTKAWGEPNSALSSALSGTDNSMTGSDRGFRSEQVSWSTGLVAYLDPADQSTVLGLGIRRPDYRTDKGLGFGSSQGAILFAHGMSPVRVEMPPRPGIGGGVRVLVYNDQGIAFALTIDAAQAKAFRGHAPVGAVDWMVIFLPGTAGKIFAMP